MGNHHRALNGTTEPVRSVRVYEKTEREALIHDDKPINDLPPNLIRSHWLSGDLYDKTVAARQEK